MFLDTSGLLCLCNHGQEQHEQSLELLRSAPRRVTHSYVLAEFVALGLVRRMALPAILVFEREVRESGGAQVIWVDEALHERGIRLLERRSDKAWSLCDAISFVLMEDLGIHEALTTDHHFEQAGFIRLLRAD